MDAKRRMDPQKVRTYRRARAAGWHALAAGQLAVEDAKLRAAEGEDRIRFEWVPDDDFDSRGYTDDDEFNEETRKKLVSGEWVAVGCIAKTPYNDHAASLWGIVGPEGDIYWRDVEIQLAGEAGVI